MSQEESFLLTLYGETDGTSATGDFPLNSEWFEATVTQINLDKGVAVKIWAKRLTGEACEVIVRLTHDRTATPITWVDLGTFYLVSAGEELFEKRRPIRFTPKTGKEAIKFSWSQVTPAKSKIGFEIEYTEKGE